MRAQFVFQEVWTGLRRNLTMTIALIVVVAISLSLLGTGLLFVKQVDNTRTYWQGKVQLSIYLCTATSVSPQCQQNGPATDGRAGTRSTTDLQALPQVEHVYYESQAAGLPAVQAGLLAATRRSPAWSPRGRDPRLLPGEAAQRPGRLHRRGRHRAGPAGVDQIVNDYVHPGQVLQAARRGQERRDRSSRSSWSSRQSCWWPTRSGCPRSTAAGRPRSCGWSAPRTSTSSCPSWSRGSSPGMFGWLIAAGLLIAVKSLGLDTPPAVLPLQRPAQPRRPDRGHPARDGHGSGPVRCHVLPHAAALPARVRPADCQGRGCRAGTQGYRPQPPCEARLSHRGRRARRASSSPAPR